MNIFKVFAEYFYNIINIMKNILQIMTRQDKIVKTSIIGIVVNLILVAFKATIGILVNSIAITLDAVNNLTDALSSIITIIGAKLAGKHLMSPIHMDTEESNISHQSSLRPLCFGRELHLSWSPGQRFSIRT